jgi:hypothetical protein
MKFMHKTGMVEFLREIWAIGGILAMNALSSMAVINSIVDLLTEAYEGPSDPSSTWFIDNVPNAGVLGMLEDVSASEASKSVDGSGQTGTTIASHTEHLRWSLAMMLAAIRGEPLGEWKESWRLLYADEAEWGRVRSSLRAEFETLQKALKIQTDLPEEYLTGLLALLPHAAYHLGVMRQMLERVRS